MDFLEIKRKIDPKRGVVTLYPSFRVKRTKDLMTRGKSFYAVWDEEAGMWSTDEFDLVNMVDRELYSEKEKLAGTPCDVRIMTDFSSDSYSEYQKYVKSLPENFKQLDDKLTFANTKVDKKDYVSKRLPYSLEPGDISAYDEIMSTLYSRDERSKIEWAIGAVIDGSSRDIQKFLVLYGEAGTGKSTVLNIVQKLFEGYYTTFEAKALASNNNSFATEVFRTNPLVAIQHDGDLSKIEDNTKLNSIVSHEIMVMNEKYKASYSARTNCFLFMGTNKPVKITDGKSGLIRRLIDVRPTGDRIPANRYQVLVSQINFELGAIAHHCLERFRRMGKHYYNGYQPLDMMFQTDIFFNFVEENYYTFRENDGTTLKAAYEMYKQYCEDTLVDFKLPRHKFREELKNYFKEYHDRYRGNYGEHRSYYRGFISNKFRSKEEAEAELPCSSISLDASVSVLDEMYGEQPAQLAKGDGTPGVSWADNSLHLKDLNTRELHYVQLPPNHIVVDFDIKGENGEKSLEDNIRAASFFPPTYAEVSKSGKGIHLHYIYAGDISKLSRVYDENIEIKTFVGNSSLRRRLTLCNNNPIAQISSGLPLKGEKMINFDSVANEKAIRTMIKKNLMKEYHPSTASSVQFIHKILQDAHDSGVSYDVTDMRPSVLSFAANSTNQSAACIKMVSEMKFRSDEPSEIKSDADGDIVFFDVEVFPNFFGVVFKPKGKPATRMYNPSPTDIESLLKMKLVGFNNKRYDNHMIYACLIGYSVEEIYKLSQKIINGGGGNNGLFAEAYGLSYADIYEYSSVKQGLKKFQIDLGIHHQELDIPWDRPLEDHEIEKVMDYCENDVTSTELVFEDRMQDFVARKILAELSGKRVNDGTRKHAVQIILNGDKNAKEKFVYTDLSEMFPGYKFEYGKSTYRGEEVGEGGYVYAEPGIYDRVALLDVESMHPNSGINLDIFGPYTKNFKELVEARLAIKHKDLEYASGLLGGVLKPYLNDDDSSALSYALKIVINSIYGYTAATFDCEFKDPRNIDNIVAKRGALFMIDLKHAVQDEGYTVIHIKTDSIKIADADEKIIKFVKDFGTKYGYKFEHEATYSKMCLVNDAVYIAKYDGGEWTATGAQFKHPYVFKTLFSGEPITLNDMSEARSVKSAMYLDFNESNADDHNYHFIGKTGLFCPVKPGTGGGILLRMQDDKYHSVTGTKDYRWKEAEVIQQLGLEDDIDTSYFGELVDAAKASIELYGSFQGFVEDLEKDHIPF